jgi:hypothetical protein
VTERRGGPTRQRGAATGAGKAPACKAGSGGNNDEPGEDEVFSSHSSSFSFFPYFSYE